jgi:MFS transporter, FSR family, fosmidomycin resistance protein
LAEITKSESGETFSNHRTRGIAVAGGAHIVHDGLTDLLYVFFPIWQAAFGLDYAAVGVLKACYSGAMAAFQLTATRLAQSMGHGPVLAAGTALAGFGFLLAGYAGSFFALLVALVIAGLGSSAQHPLASDIVVLTAPPTRRRQALGLYNTTGDIGKVLFPALATPMLIVLSPAAVLEVTGAIAVAAAAAILVALWHLGPGAAPTDQANEPSCRAPGEARVSMWRHPGFAALFGIGVIDGAARAGFMTFFPLVLAAKGASTPTIGLAITLLFVGGAIGKYACGPLGARFGVLWTVAVTEGATALAALVTPLAPPWLCLAIAPLVGIALNGTSTVLYGTVPELVPASARTRAFGLFYTGTIGASAAAPIMLGLIGDLVSIEAAMAGLALSVLTAPVLTLGLRAPLARAPVA